MKCRRYALSRAERTSGVQRREHANSTCRPQQKALLHSEIEWVAPGSGNRLLMKTEPVAQVPIDQVLKLFDVWSVVLQKLMPDRF